MLMPKRVKHRKQFRGSMKGKALRGNKITYGDFGIVATEPAWIKSNQIEAARIAMTRYIKRGGKVWIKIFPDKPVTKTPAETRMGKGKGALEYWVAVVKPGRVMFEYPLFRWKLNPMFGAAAMSLSSFCVVTNALRLNFVKVYSTRRDSKRSSSSCNTQIAGKM